MAAPGLVRWRAAPNPGGGQVSLAVGPEALRRKRGRRRGHRGGAHRHRFEKVMRHTGVGFFGETCMYFDNITSWRGHAKNYLLTEVKADVMLIAETHVPKPKA